MRKPAEISALKAKRIMLKNINILFNVNFSLDKCSINFDNF